MSDDCIDLGHQWKFASVATDPYDTIHMTEFAYYYCEKCLETIKKRVTPEVES